MNSNAQTCPQNRQTTSLDLFTFTRAEDLTVADMHVLYGLLLDEKLLQVFFHDCEHMSFNGFINYARNPAAWFYAVEKNGLWAGLFMLNNFSSSGAAGFLHACSLGNCRGNSAKCGLNEFLAFLAAHSPLQSLAALIPKPYRGARDLMRACDFKEIARLPQAMRLHRRGNTKDVDGCLFMRVL